MSERGSPGHYSPTLSNPRLIIFDTDALVQVFLVNEIRPLRELKRLYGVQPTIVEAVEFETLFPGKGLTKHVATIQPRLQKALNNGTLIVLNERTLPAIVGPGAHAVWTQISIIGTRFHRVADYGEAYSHATAAVLSAPVVTHDLTAIRALARAGEQIGPLVLRVFDLYVFAHQCGLLSVQDCDDSRQILSGQGEWLPDAFLRRNFSDGLPLFFARILDKDLAPIGSSVPVEVHDGRLFLSR